MTTSDPLPNLPVIAERYRIVRELGEGGMGVVYEVIDDKTNRRRALKRIRAHVALDAELIRRFEHEVTVAGRVESDHVVEVFDAGFDEATGAPYLVMELLSGEDLGRLVGREGGLGVERTLTIFEQLAHGLGRTHAEAIVHRDIKPENVFLTERDDGSFLVKVLDFGVAKTLATGSLSPATTRIVGTPLYMAPEQFSGDGTIDARADVYAVGQLAFTVLVGNPYFDDEMKKRFALPSLAMAIASPARDPASTRAASRGAALPEGFDDWFRRATAAEPDDRFETVTAAYEALRDALLAPPRSQAPVRAPAAPRRWSPAVAIAMAAVGVIGWLVWGASRADMSPEPVSLERASETSRPVVDPTSKADPTMRPEDVAASPPPLPSAPTAPTSAKSSAASPGAVAAPPATPPSSASPSATPYDPLQDL